MIIDSLGPVPAPPRPKQTPRQRRRALHKNNRIINQVLRKVDPSWPK